MPPPPAICLEEASQRDGWGNCCSNINLNAEREGSSCLQSSAKGPKTCKESVWGGPSPATSSGHTARTCSGRKQGPSDQQRPPPCSWQTLTTSRLGDVQGKLHWDREKTPWHEDKVLTVAPTLGIPSSGGFAGSAQGGQWGTRGAVGVEELFMLSRWHCKPCIVGIQSSLFPLWNKTWTDDLPMGVDWWWLHRERHLSWK